MTRPRIVAVDPGPDCGVVVYDPEISAPIVFAGRIPALALRPMLRDRRLTPLDVNGDEVSLTGPHVLAIEVMRARGKPTSNDEFDTCILTGRLIEAWGDPWAPVFRRDVKMALLGEAAANDAMIRAELVERFGGEKVALERPRKCEACDGKGKIYGGAVLAPPEKRKRVWIPCDVCHETGRVGKDGPLLHVVRDTLAALAVAVTYNLKGASKL